MRRTHSSNWWTILKVSSLSVKRRTGLGTKEKEAEEEEEEKEKEEEVYE